MEKIDAAVLALWKRFERVMNTAYEYNTLILCHMCPYAIKTEKVEPRLDRRRFPGLDESWYAPVDNSTFRPTRSDGRCKMCFDSWIEEKKSEGRICVKCGVWITKENEGLTVIAQHETEDGRTHMSEKTAVCGLCLTGGKTLEEWARGLAERIKQKEERPSNG